MWMRLSPALLMALLACGPVPPAESPAIESEAPVDPPAPVAVQPLPQAPRAAVSGGVAITGAKSEAPVDPPTPVVVQPLPQAPRAAVSGGGAITGAKIDHADRALASLRKRMRSCYQQAINQHPSEAGTYAFTMQVDAQGSVTSAEGSGDGSLSPETLACFSAVMNSTRFTAPEGLSATVRGNFRFAPTATTVP